MSPWTTASAIAVIALFSAVEVDARGGGGGGRGGGGGGAVRGGVASNGSFASGSFSGSSSGARAQARDKVSQLPSNGRGDWDAGARPPGLAAGIVVGVAIARRAYLASDGYYYYYDAPFSTLPCSPREIDVAGVKYYQCGSDFFVLTYEGGSVVYVQVDPPPGY